MARTAGSHAETTRPRVEAAAQALFARHGFAAVSMRQIAQEAGLQAGALYKYFADKQTLLLVLLRSHMEALLEALPDAEGAPAADLERFVRFHVLFHLVRPDAVFIAYMELRNLTEANFTQIEALRRDYEHRLEAILRDGAQARTMRVEDTRLTSMAIIALLTGVTTWYRPGGRLSEEDVADHYVALVRRMVSLPDS